MMDPNDRKNPDSRWLLHRPDDFSRGEDQKNEISIKLAGLPKLNPVALSYWTFVLIIPFYYRIMAILTGTGALTFPTVRLPIWKALRNRLPHVVTQSRKSVGSLLIWYGLFNGFLSHFLYFSVQYFSSLMSDIDIEPFSWIPPLKMLFRLSLAVRLAGVGLFMIGSWNVIFMICEVFWTQPAQITQKNAIDSNGCLLDGLMRFDKPFMQHHAFLELLLIVKTEPSKRITIFRDIDRQMWTHVCDACIKVIDSLRESIEVERRTAAQRQPDFVTKYTRPSAPPSHQPIDAGSTIPGGMTISAAPRHVLHTQENVFAASKESLLTKIIKFGLAFVNRIYSVDDNVPPLKQVTPIPSSQLSFIPSNQPMRPTLFQPTLAAPKLPLKEPLPARIRATVSKTAREFGLYLAEKYLPRQLSLSHVADTNVKVRTRVIFTNWQMQTWAIESLAILTSSSIKEDDYGVVQRDITRILQCLIATLMAIENYLNQPTFSGWRLHQNSLYQRKSALGLKKFGTTSRNMVERNTAAWMNERTRKMAASLGNADDVEKICCAVIDALQNAIYLITITFHDHLREFKLPSKYAAKLQSFIDFKEG
ncbi:nucleoporin protein Ndc1-Nup [Paraphysoderma sedebokerense]|nr:nucleoporin protein Ndc1-Nup [Paraphysoderma sedebokerense]